MFRTVNSVRMLQAIAMIAGLAILLWSLGLPSLRFADAANITTVSDTLSDSAPSAVSDHTFVFTTPTGVAAGETIIIDFGANFNPSALDFGDVDFASTTDITLAGSASGGTWGVATDATSITLTSATGVIDANATVTIQVGLNATFGPAGDTQITNNASVGSYEINFTVGSSDSGATRVALIDSVTVTASVDTIFTFAVSGVAAGQSVNGDTTTGLTTTTTIPFGTLTDGTATITAQRLTVNTNADNGYVVTVEIDGALESSTGADINGFSNGSDTNIPATWVVPSETLGLPDTYGHWGVTSDDATTTRSNQFGSQQYIAASTSPRVVMSNDGPSNGTGVGVGTTTVGYQIEISGLQEAGDDYQAILTYIATPTF